MLTNATSLYNMKQPDKLAEIGEITSLGLFSSNLKAGDMPVCVFSSVSLRWSYELRFSSS